MISKGSLGPLKNLTDGKQVKEKTLLSTDHFFHHCLLVTGIRILCEDVITNNDIDIAHAMLVHYTRLLPVLYGETESTYNSHCLTHCAEQVRAHGPLILHSTFVFESMLAHLKRLFHGTRGISDQIYRKLGFTQHSNQHLQRHVEGNRAAKEFADKRMPSKFSKGEELDGGIQYLPCDNKFQQ